MTVCIAKPQHTYAVVVGIEHYAAGQDWDVPGPASDARRFADWLVRRQVPYANIMLFLSPLDQDEKAAMLQWPGSAILPATREKVRSVFTHTLHQKQGDLLYVFWSGHGITAETGRKLFYADATQIDKQHLELTTLLRFLRSDYFPQGFRQQIYLINACANYVTRHHLLTALSPDGFPDGRPFRGRDQFVLFAAKEGELAKNRNAIRSGLFSQVMMEELAQEPDDCWPPRMDLVTERVKARFAQLGEEGIAQQTPIHWWLRGWDGDEQSFVQEGTQSPEPPLESLTPDQQLTLAEKLFRCAVMNYRSSRERLKSLLPEDIRATLSSEPGTERDEVIDIVQKCSYYPGGIKVLLNFVRRLEKNSLPMQQVESYLKTLL
jgi:hypothetical protein